MGHTSAHEWLGGPVCRGYENGFVMRFDDDGRGREFTEYFIQRP